MKATNWICKQTSRTHHALCARLLSDRRYFLRAPRVAVRYYGNAAARSRLDRKRDGREGDGVGRGLVSRASVYGYV